MSHTPVGTIITAAKFNEVVDDYDVIWRGPKDGSGNLIVYTYDAALHVSEAARQTGWGQPNAVTPTVNPQVIIDADHYNTLASYVNTGDYHRADNNAVPNLITHVADTNRRILSSDTNIIENRITQLTTTNQKFDLGVDNIFDIVLGSISNGGTPWGTNDLASDGTRGTLVCEMKYVFSSYDDARHWFNSGGQCTLNLDAVGGNHGSSEWNICFDQIDTVFFGGLTTYRNGTNGIGQRNFYELTQTYQQIFNAVGFDSSAYGSAYTGYTGGYSTYGGREVTINARVDMDGTDFVVYFQVILTEDADDIYQVDCNITLNGGCKTADESPNSGYLGTSNASFHTVNSNTYKFLTMSSKKPTVSQHSAWTDGAVTTVTSVFGITPSSLTFNEGQSMFFTITDANNISTPQTLYWDIVGTGVTASDFTSGTLTGAITWPSTTTVTLTSVADLTTENAESFVLNLRTGSNTGTIVATSATITINDTSQTPSPITPPAPTYVLTPTATTINEGGSVRIDIGGANLPVAGTTVGYTITGITVADLDTTNASYINSLTGNFTIVSGQSISILIANDTLTEGNETLTLTLDATDSLGNSTGSVSQAVTITDTSLTPPTQYYVSDVMASYWVNEAAVTTALINASIQGIENFRSRCFANNIADSDFDSMIQDVIDFDIPGFQTTFTSRLTPTQQNAIGLGILDLINGYIPIANALSGNSMSLYSTNSDLRGLVSFAFDVLNPDGTSGMQNPTFNADINLLGTRSATRTDSDNRLTDLLITNSTSAFTSTTPIPLGSWTP